jgi:hypothetical protein
MRAVFGGHKEPLEYANPTPQDAPNIVSLKAGRL